MNIEKTKDKKIENKLMNEKRRSPDLNKFKMPKKLIAPSTGIDNKKEILADSTQIGRAHV